MQLKALIFQVETTDQDDTFRKLKVYLEQKPRCKYTFGVWMMLLGEAIGVKKLTNDCIATLYAEGCNQNKASKQCITTIITSRVQWISADRINRVWKAKRVVDFHYAMDCRPGGGVPVEHVWEIERYRWSTLWKVERLHNFRWTHKQLRWRRDWKRGEEREIDK